MSIIDLAVLTDGQGNAALVADLGNGAGELVAIAGPDVESLTPDARAWLHNRALDVTEHPLATDQDDAGDVDWFGPDGIDAETSLDVLHFENASGSIWKYFDADGVLWSKRHEASDGASPATMEALTVAWHELLSTSPHDEVTADSDGPGVWIYETRALSVPIG